MEFIGVLVLGFRISEGCTVTPLHLEFLAVKLCFVWNLRGKVKNLDILKGDGGRREGWFRKYVMPNKTCLMFRSACSQFEPKNKLL